LKGLEEEGQHLVLAEGAGLAQQSVQQGRLAVIDVGDDRQVAEIFAQFFHGNEGRLAAAGDRHVAHASSRSRDAVLRQPRWR